MCILFDLFEIIFEIVCYFLHKMDSIFAHNIMLGAWVDEVVDWNVVGDTSIEEVEWVLIEDNIVDESLTDEKFATKIFCFIN